MVQTSSQSTVNKIEMRLRGKGRGGDRHGHHPFGEDARILRVDRQVGRTDQGARRKHPQRPVG